MKKIKMITSIILVMFLIMGCSSTETPIDNTQSDEGVAVAVSIIPEETFARKVMGNLGSIVTMIPPGGSPANYQPQPQEMIALSEADIYFGIDVQAEINNIQPNIDEYNEDIVYIDLAEIVDETYPALFFGEDEHTHEAVESHEEDDHNHESEEESHEDTDHEEEGHEEEGHDHAHEGRDPHIWMSPKRAIVMVDTMKHEISLIDQENQSYYEDNARVYIEELENLDQYIRDALAPYKGKSVIIFHPAIGYYCDDYELNMLALESDGKEATAKGIENIVEFAREEGITTVFYQDEFDSQQAEIVANEIGGKAVEISPLSADYIENMKEMTEQIVASFNGEVN